MKAIMWMNVWVENLISTFQPLYEFTLMFQQDIKTGND